MSGSSIPASAIVNVIPGVLSAGGDGLVLNGLMLTQNARVPIGQVASYASATAVGAALGAASVDQTWATVYFNGYENSDALPTALLVAQYNLAAVGAYMRTGNISGLSITQLQAISGTLSILVDGTAKSGTINFTGLTSFSAAAASIATTLALTAIPAASVTGTIAATVLTVTAVASGALAVGDVITGTGVTAGTTIVSFGTGTGGTGTYNVSVSQTVATAETITATSSPVVYDSVTGAFVFYSATTGTTSSVSTATGTAAATILATTATGAVTSLGAAAATPATFMNGILGITQNWASFALNFNPDVTGNAIKLAFALWTSQQEDRFAYMAWDTDITPTQSTAATSSLGYICGTLQYSGVVPIYDPSNEALAAFAMGYVASLDFTQTNGAATLAFKSQSGLSPTVTNQTIAANLLANYYNFYGQYATANQNFIWWQDGGITGPFLWADAYVYQIWLNAAFQLALMELLASVGAIPYNAAGYALIAGALYSGGGSASSSLSGDAQNPAGPIAVAVNFGVITPGVQLASTQIQAVNNAAGKDIATTLQNRGWYLQVKDPGAQARVTRSSPACTFWYNQGGSVQSITLNSIELQ